MALSSNVMRDENDKVSLWLPCLRLSNFWAY